MNKRCRAWCLRLIVYILFMQVLTWSYVTLLITSTTYDDVSVSSQLCVHNVREYVGLSASDDMIFADAACHSTGAPTPNKGGNGEPFSSVVNATQRSCTYSGVGVHIVLVDTGLAKDFARHSVNTVRCLSVVPHVPCHDDGYEHGTRSASVLAGNLHTSDAHYAKPRASRYHFLGMAPMAEVLVIRVFDQSGVSRPEYVLRALQMALDVHADVVSLSCGGDVRSSSLWRNYTAQVTEVISALIARGAVVVAAAGNDGPGEFTVRFPANLPGVITVGALQRDCAYATETTRGAAGGRARGHEQRHRGHCRGCDHDHRTVSYFSSRGTLRSTPKLPRVLGEHDDYTEAEGPKPNVVALGENVLAVEDIRTEDEMVSTASSGSNASHANRARLSNKTVPKSTHTDLPSVPTQKELVTVTASGTSIAAPLVAGTVALCIEQLRRMPGVPVNSATIASLLMRTASPLLPRTSSHSPELFQQSFLSFLRNLMRMLHVLPTGSVVSTVLHDPEEWNAAYVHYNLVHNSVMAQGAGEVQPRRLLQYLEESRTTYTRSANARRRNLFCRHDKQRVHHDCTGHSVNDTCPIAKHGRAFDTASISAAALPLSYVFPPRIHATSRSSLSPSPWPYRQQSLVMGARARVFHFTTYLAHAAQMEQVSMPFIHIQRACAVSSLSQNARHRNAMNRHDTKNHTTTRAAMRCREFLHRSGDDVSVLAYAWVHSVIDIRVTASPVIMNYVGRMTMTVSAQRHARDETHTANAYAYVLVVGEAAVHYRKVANTTIGCDMPEQLHTGHSATIMMMTSTAAVADYNNELVHSILCAHHVAQSAEDIGERSTSGCSELRTITLRVPFLFSLEPPSLLSASI